MDDDYDDDVRGWLTTAVEVVMVWLGFGFALSLVKVVTAATPVIGIHRLVDGGVAGCRWVVVTVVVGVGVGDGRWRD
ncbi:hypothetical protein Hanom_Chr06g00556401 [Helianthus anomalus]